MSDLRDAARQALEALDVFADAIRVWPEETRAPHEFAAMDKGEAAIAALRAALAEEQEPVAWMRPDNRVAEESTARTQFSRGAVKPPIGTWVPLYTHPPRREWQPLTEKDIWTLAANSLDRLSPKLKQFARAIEAALKERNA